MLLTEWKNLKLFQIQVSSNVNWIPRLWAGGQFAVSVEKLLLLSWNYESTGERFIDNETKLVYNPKLYK